VQAFDALAIKAVLQEAGPLLINLKVESVQQIHRDEIFLTLTGRRGRIHLRLSAHPLYGRLSLVKGSTNCQQSETSDNWRSSFATLLKRDLTNATLVGLEQVAGDRILDLIFSCRDAVGSLSHKTLTLEIMGRHSNIIFWERADQRIIAASHAVTEEMSRPRQIVPGYKYTRPPRQAKPSILNLTKTDFERLWRSCPFGLSERLTSLADQIESWLISNCSGLGKSLAQEIGQAATCLIGCLPYNSDAVKNLLWQLIAKVQSTREFKPAIKLDGSRYSLLNLGSPYALDDGIDRWRALPTVSDLIEEFYNTASEQEKFRQLRERMLKEMLKIIDKLENRKKSSCRANQDQNFHRYKLFGDLILANLWAIQKGQSTLTCRNIFSENAEEVTITLNCNLTPAQNAQDYYKQFAVGRKRQRSMNLSKNNWQAQLANSKAALQAIEEARSFEELNMLKLNIHNGVRKGGGGQSRSLRKERSRSRFLRLVSSEGWLIYVGRNHNENSELLSCLAKPQDIWLHILGHSGAHVLIKVPSSHTQPPFATIGEAAQVAARFSKVALGSKVRVVYTQARFVKPIKHTKESPKGKTSRNASQGLVRYEKERTIEVDIATNLPEILKQLFEAKSQS